MAAPLQRPPGRRPVPVAADTRRLRQGPGRTPAAVPDAAVDRGRFRRPGPQPTGHPRRGHRPAVRTASLGGRSAESTSDTWQCRQAAASAHCGSRAGVPGWSAPAAAVSPPLLKGLRWCPRWTAAVRGGTDRTQPHLGTAAVSGSADTCWGSRLGPRRRWTSTVRTRGQWTRLVDTGSRRRPALRTPATAGSVVRSVMSSECARVDSRAPWWNDFENDQLRQEADRSTR
jgi:hypothetical protein